MAFFGENRILSLDIVDTTINSPFQTPSLTWVLTYTKTRILFKKKKRKMSERILDKGFLGIAKRYRPQHFRYLARIGQRHQFFFDQRYFFNFYFWMWCVCACFNLNVSVYVRACENVLPTPIPSPRPSPSQNPEPNDRRTIKSFWGVYG
jgi:hypothetical protein